jgi:small subunit ribosomal protein S16
MALKIRLRQQGKKNYEVYRLVLTDSRSPRDGKYIETLGWYNPFEAEPEKNAMIREERIMHWMDQGAIVSERAQALIKRHAPKILELFRKKQTEKKTRLIQKRREAKLAKA